MPPAGQVPRRVRAAHSILTRIQSQRDWFATAYGAARTPQQRFHVAATAVRAAAAGRKHRPLLDAEQRLDRITDQIIQLVDELQKAQQHAAEATVRADARRLARNERRNRHVSRPQQPAEPTGPTSAA